MVPEIDVVHELDLGRILYTYGLSMVGAIIFFGHANVVHSRVLPMFHAAGWTFPWSITFAFAAQVRRTILPHCVLTDAL